jgi:hypothetical protein
VEGRASTQEQPALKQERKAESSAPAEGIRISRSDFESSAGSAVPKAGVSRSDF